MLTLRYLPANAVWAFFYNDVLIHLEGFPFFFHRRQRAHTAALSLGLRISRTGQVSRPRSVHR